MKRKDTLPELLAPAGDMQCLYAAVKAGADAIYVGGRTFGARAFAKNFDAEELRHAVSYCHLHGVKLYVTVNTLVYDREMRELSDFVCELYKIGVDAVITADLGVIREIKRRVPRLPIHASTQMSVHNLDGAEAAASLGCERVVVARELPRDDIKAVTEHSSIEIEVFLHGALCVCHSGQCLMSSLVGGRSGNRGECAQPCRLPYNERYPLSLSDLSLANHINELVDLGVSSLKIEGRMKAPEYVYTVTSIYRTLLDERRCATKSERARLAEVFSRGGFTDGYFVGKKQSDMTGVRSAEDKVKTKALEPMSFSAEKVAVKAEAVLKRGAPSSLALTLGEKGVIAYGDEPLDAINAPLTEDAVKARLSKMGATLLSLSPEDIDLSLDEGINMSPSALNALRRDAAAMLEDASRDGEIPEYSVENFARDGGKQLTTAQFLFTESFLSLKRENPNDISLFNIVFLPITDYSPEANGVFIPPIVFDSEIEDVESLLLSARERGCEYALVGNIGHIAMARRAGLTPIGDFRLNVTNKYARREYRELGIDTVILSPELTLPMARDISGGEIVYGRIPLMITERCFIKENFGCEQCNRASLSDRTGAKFPLVREYGHRNLILNCRPTYMGDKKDELVAAKISHAHLFFTTESQKLIHNVITAYMRGEPLDMPVRRVGKRSEGTQKGGTKEHGGHKNGKKKF